MVVLSAECFCYHFFIQVSSWRKVCLSTKARFDRFVQSLVTRHFKGMTGYLELDLWKFTKSFLVVLANKPHPRFGTKFTGKKCGLYVGVYGMLKIYFLLSSSKAFNYFLLLNAYLKHFVWGRFNTRNHTCRIKSTLLYLCKVVLWVAIKHHFANWNEWVLRMWPDLIIKDSVSKYKSNEDLLTVGIRKYI